MKKKKSETQNALDALDTLSIMENAKQGFNFAMQDAIDKDLIKVIINDNGERVVKIIASVEEIKQAYLNDDDLTDEQKGEIKNDDTNESN